MKRRGNGLVADSYAPLTDLPAHLADRLLDALREAGVAAYVTPTEDPAAAAAAGSDGGSVDRLYVDTDMRSAAEGVLNVHLPGMGEGGPTIATGGDLLERTEEPGGTGDREQREAAGPDRDDDAIWAEIVAGFDDEPEGERPWPEQENVKEAREPAEADDANDDAEDDNSDRTGRLPLARVIKPADEPLPPDDEGHYIPPPPPPLPSTDKVTKLAWAALVGGPLYLLVTVILGWEVPGWAAFLAVAAFIGGFVTLVLRMGDDPRDTDDGAIV